MSPCSACKRLVATRACTDSTMHSALCWTSQRRTFSTHEAVSNGVLLRHFIYDSLYHETDGYFAKQPSVGSLAQPTGLDWRAMHGQRGIISLAPLSYVSLSSAVRALPQHVLGADYEAAVSQRYRELKVAWLTPAEIFSPWVRMARQWLYSIYMNGALTV